MHFGVNNVHGHGRIFCDLNNETGIVHKVNCFIALFCRAHFFLIPDISVSILLSIFIFYIYHHEGCVTGLIASNTTACASLIIDSGWNVRVHFTLACFLGSVHIAVYLHA